MSKSTRTPKLGQHFLASEKALERITRAACPPGTDLVVEIGPGGGALTVRLIEASHKLVAIELDSALAAALRVRWPGIEVVEADALDVDFTRWGPGVLAGNLPYYVSTAIISKYLASPGELRQAVFLIQKEVAERITAKPGGREFGYFSVECQAQAECEYLFSVPPGAFRPPPKVDSAVVRLTPKPHSPDTAGFLKFASACFRQKRKTLRNNLAAVIAADRLAACEGLNRRAEQLSVEELAALYRRLTVEDTRL